MIRGRERGIGQREHPEGQENGADANPGAVLEGNLRFDLPVSQEGAVLAAEVFERRALRRHDDPGVSAGDACVVDEQTRAGISPDDGFARSRGIRLRPRKIQKALLRPGIEDTLARTSSALPQNA